MRWLTRVDGYEVDPAKVRDISGEVLGPDGRFRILPAEYWATTTREERALFGAHHGIYSFPTTELVEHLQELIGDRTAIEIGAGNGVLAETLGIPATDNFQQKMARYRDVYSSGDQQAVPYGPNVVEMDARQAVRRHRPQVVLSCWVTHRYNKARHFAGGNEKGVDEAALIAQVDTYVVVGNERVHRNKPIWELPHEIIYPNWLYSRAMNRTRNFIATWQRSVDPLP